MSNPKISFQDIQQGDTIRVEWAFEDAQLTRVGTASQRRTGDWYTGMGAQLTQEFRDAVYYLLDRPVPPLPTEPGTIIISEQPVEQGPIPLILRKESWWYLNGESFYHANSVQQRPWKLAKVVEA
jgi:hypothetical protein